MHLFYNLIYCNANLLKQKKSFLYVQLTIYFMAKKVTNKSKLKYKMYV